MNEYTQKFIVPVLLGGLLYVAGQYVASQPGREQQVVESGREITVTGEGTVSIRPDVAKVTVGTQAGSLPTAEAAMESLATSFNQVVDAVKEAGISEDDIRTTNFSVNPTYDYIDGRQTLRGFTASEQVVVTIRDLDRIGEVLSVATSTGANQIGGVNFTVDDEQGVQAEAEEAAIEKAREKAERIAKALGARLGDVKKYEVSNGGTPTPIALRETAADVGVGGAAPPVPVGTSDVEVTVTITFQLQ